MSKEKEQVKKLDGSDDQEDNTADTPSDTKKLTKNQKKKLREKKKKQQERAVADGPIATATTETKPVDNKQSATDNGADDEKVEVGKAEKQGKQEKTKEGKKEDKGKKGGKSNPAAVLAKKMREARQKQEAEIERQRKEFEQAERKRIQQIQQRQRLEREEREREILEAKLQIKESKKKGIYIKKRQKEKYERMRAQLNAQEETKVQRTEGEILDDGEDIEGECEPTEEQIKAEIEKIRKQKRKDESSVLRDDRSYFAKRQGEFRSPVCCILGHVDTGKTTLLDKIRRTNVQEGEAGGITQQIGATFFPEEKLIAQIKKCESFYPNEVKIPGLLIIDTPGHESFANLRSRGSSLCDIAILVIDLQHGLQNQTLQSLELLSKRKTPFVVALNKIDRSYGWQATPDGSSYLSLQRQKEQTRHDYETKLRKIITQLNSKGYNAALYWQNEDPLEYISLVPTSGITGEGLPDLLSVIALYSHKLQSITQRIRIRPNVFSCTVMEVKMQEGHGTTIDCILVDGVIRKDDQIVLLGFQGPIVTKVKAILTPHPMKQMRIKDEYLHHREIFAANGLKISANGLDNAVAGTPLIVVHNEEQIENAKAICQNEFDNVKRKIKLENIGVGVVASTLGSLEALLEYLQKSKIPVSYVSVGPVSKDDVKKSMKTMLSQLPQRRKKQYSCMLVFDIKVLPDAQKYAEQNEIRIFTANIIYHLTQHFKKYVDEMREERKKREGREAVFPCILEQVATFRKCDPILLGVDVVAGVLKIGTPICVYKEGERGDKQLKLGVIQSIQHNHKKIDEARRATGSVAIAFGGDPKIESGRQFDPKDKLVSIISRRSIDCLREHYRQEVTNEEWLLIAELKKYFNVHP